MIPSCFTRVSLMFYSCVSLAFPPCFPPFCTRICLFLSGLTELGERADARDDHDGLHAAGCGRHDGGVPALEEQGHPPRLRGVAAGKGGRYMYILLLGGGTFYCQAFCCFADVHIPLDCGGFATGKEVGVIHFSRAGSYLSDRGPDF